ncbi:MAG: hypothetical protein R6X02_06695 [Enhygromyxa sp.]
MIQFKITFADPGTGDPVPAPVCQSTSSNSLSIISDNGLSKYGTNLDVIDFIEVYVSGTAGDAHDFYIVADDPTGTHRVGTARHASDYRSDYGGCMWSRPRTGVLEFKFKSPAAIDTNHLWAFETETPGLVLKVKVKRQQSPVSGACSGWPPIVVDQPPRDPTPPPT